MVDKRLTSYGKDNLVMDAVPLTKILEMDIVDGTWVKKNLLGNIEQTWTQMKQYTLSYFMKYRYVGMTLDTARACKNAVKGAWTKTSVYWQWNETDGIWEKKNGPSYNIANISIEKSSGTMYDVVVEVNQTLQGFQLPSGAMFLSDFPSYLQSETPPTLGE